MALSANQDTRQFGVAARKNVPFAEHLHHEIEGGLAGLRPARDIDVDLSLIVLNTYGGARR